MWTLFYTPNTCALASHIALEEAGADYETRRIDFASQEQRSPDYLKINPLGRVPALVTERGILTETPAILAFIAQSFPDSGLAPLDDPFGFAKAQSFNSYLCSTVHVAHAHRMRGHRWVDPADTEAIEAMRRKVPESVTAAFQLVENALPEGGWVLGDQYSVCDAYLFTLAQWLDGDGVDLAVLPKVVAHRERVRERPATQRAVQQEQG